MCYSRECTFQECNVVQREARKHPHLLALMSKFTISKDNLKSFRMYDATREMNGMTERALACVMQTQNEFNQSFIHFLNTNV